MGFAPENTAVNTPPPAVLQPNAPFPDPSLAWGGDSPAPGLLAVGGDLSVPRLLQAYGNGIFPWYSDGQPILWWSPAPRMVLYPGEFKLHPSLKKKLRQLLREQRLQIRVDHDFSNVIRHCANAQREGQDGTWITADMQAAYAQFHTAGFAHCMTAWVDGELAGGLYGVGLGQAVFGESMFHLQTDGSKLALCALVAWARANAIPQIDCQQNTRHLSSLGAREVDRGAFVQRVRVLAAKPAVQWQFEAVYWNELLNQTVHTSDERPPS
jgi:leucyl/phenylalanyl-tRNA--protein transferase